MTQSSTEWVAGWQPSELLQALRTLLNHGMQVTPAVARRAGLTQTEMAVLEHLMDQPLGPTELAQRLGVTTAAASGIVDRLVARGHVERSAHASDRRRTVVGCTPSGREEVLGHLMPMFVELARVDADLDAQEREIVLRFLHRADQALTRLL